MGQRGNPDQVCRIVALVPGTAPISIINSDAGQGALLLCEQGLQVSMCGVDCKQDAQQGLRSSCSADVESLS